ncbi:FAD/NAD(P)-binding protein [Streptomyces celluloflavus]|uniref:FAD/NAD(P)-binding protein n=1 Tax=Streptomyces celluloflavus TaxID=58344 RepID=UPI00365B4E34
MPLSQSTDARRIPAGVPGSGRAGCGRLRVAVVGAGPRGLSVLERLCANARAEHAGRPLTVHVIDPYPPGAGRVWRTAQSRHLLMNTVASQITVYTDAGVRIDGPVEPGPSLYEWAAALETDGGAGGVAAAVRAEARRLSPDDYPTRAFYGHYLEDAYRRIVAGAPGGVRVVAHRRRAVALDQDRRGGQHLVLDDGTRLDALDAVVLAQGHLDAVLAPGEAELGSAARELGLGYVPPANPADVDLSWIGPERTVLLRGLGLNFFDHLALFTLGRGGVFTRSGGRVVYRASGREPRLLAGSRRGIPYHARGENEKGAHGRHLPRLLTPEVIAQLRKRAQAGERLRFDTDLWPLIDAEVSCVYYAALLAARGRGVWCGRFAEEFLDAPDAAARDRLLDTWAIAPGERWDWERLAGPGPAGGFADRGAFRAWLLGHLRADVAAARAGNVSGPLKAALDALRDLRNEIRLVVDHGGLEGRSYREHLQSWYTPLNAFLSIGPPVSRIEEMAALIEAGVLEVLGPGTWVRVDRARRAFVAASSVPGPQVAADVLIEARLPEPDVRRTTDPLLRRLLAAGGCAPYRIPTADGAGYETGGLAVGARPYRLLDADGRASGRRFAYGVPTEAVHWITAAGIRPGVDSVTLGDSDAIARAVLALSPVSGGVRLDTGLSEVSS